MSRAKIVLDSEGRFYAVEIKCPSGHTHTLPTNWTPPGMARSPHIRAVQWEFNGDLERPTFKPSILSRNGHFLEEHQAGKSCWCTYNAEHPDEPAPFVCCCCHSFVTDGRIQFLGDCSHALKGQTVDLPEIEDEAP